MRMQRIGPMKRIVLGRGEWLGSRARNQGDGHSGRPSLPSGCSPSFMCWRRQRFAREESIRSIRQIRSIRIASLGTLTCGELVLRTWRLPEVV